MDACVSLPECVAVVAAGELPPLQRLLSCAWMLLRNDAASSNGRDSSSLYRTSTRQYESWKENPKRAHM